MTKVYMKIISMYNENKTIVFGHEYSSRYSISRHFNSYMYIIQLIVFNLKRNDKCSSKIIHSFSVKNNLARAVLIPQRNNIYH